MTANFECGGRGAVATPLLGRVRTASGSDRVTVYHSGSIDPVATAPGSDTSVTGRRNAPDFVQANQAFWYAQRHVAGFPGGKESCSPTAAEQICFAD